MKKVIKLNNIKEIAKTFQSFDDMYDYLIKTNDIEICNFCYDNDGIWKRLSLKWMLDYFTEKEEYEKCLILKNLMQKHFIANNRKQIELHKTKDKCNSLY
jgi:hypothetical protein